MCERAREIVCVCVCARARVCVCVCVFVCVEIYTENKFICIL